jgi:hypothetical protein
MLRAVTRCSRATCFIGTFQRDEQNYRLIRQRPARIFVVGQDPRGVGPEHVYSKVGMTIRLLYGVASAERGIFLQRRKCKTLKKPAPAFTHRNNSNPHGRRGQAGGIGTPFFGARPKNTSLEFFDAGFKSVLAMLLPTLLATFPAARHRIAQSRLPVSYVLTEDNYLTTAFTIW